MQFEPATVRDCYDYYTNVAPKDSFLADLACSATISSDDLYTFFNAFFNSDAPTNNQWPSDGTSPEGQIENLITNMDSFGITLLHYQLTRGTT
ncbi:MAG: hypothetical protein ACRD3W_12070 [Terriglobales bacterium]